MFSLFCSVKIRNKKEEHLVCHDAICAQSEQDGKIYEKVYPTLNSIFRAQQDYIRELVNDKMKNVGLKGIWSIDLMYAENKYWLIDMAIGCRSAYWDPKRAQIEQSR